MLQFQPENKQNRTVNALILIFCVLLMGFVYINTRLTDQFYQERAKESLRSVPMEQMEGDLPAR